MKRLLMIGTAIVALGAPVAAQSDAAETVMQGLQSLGYGEARIEMLNDDQIAQIYIAMTADDNERVRELMDGYMADAQAGGTAMPSDARAVVGDALARNGYDAMMIDDLGANEIASLYVPATGEDQAAFRQAVAALDLGAVDNDTPGAPVDAASRAFVRSELEARGYAASEIETISDAEFAELYLALTSEDEQAFEEVITSALDS